MTSDEGNLHLVTTHDGSSTLYNAILGVHYHSVAGAEGESRHVFFEGTGFQSLLGQHQPLRILEVGLGTGLNVLLAAEAASSPVAYVSIEPFPPQTTLLHQLFGSRFPGHWVDALYSTPSGWVELGQLNLQWLPTTFQEAEVPEAHFHAVFYDPFAPRSAPEMWEPDVLMKAYGALAPGGRMATYSISGATKRFLKNQGIPFRRPPGFGPKREMLILEKPED